MNKTFPHENFFLYLLQMYGVEFLGFLFTDYVSYVTYTIPVMKIMILMVYPGTVL